MNLNFTSSIFINVHWLQMYHFLGGPVFNVNTLKNITNYFYYLLYKVVYYKQVNTEMSQFEL